VKEQVVLEKYGSNDDKKLQSFYCFERGILGRTGNDYRVLPVIEHGFWGAGVRKTLVIVYDTETYCLEKLCFVQPERRHDEDFNVSASNPLEVSVLPNTPTASLEQMQSSWKRFCIKEAESISSDGHQQVEHAAMESDALAQLLKGDGDNDDNDKCFELCFPMISCWLARGVFQRMGALQYSWHVKQSWVRYIWWTLSLIIRHFKR